jgi:dGTPase
MERDVPPSRFERKIEEKSERTRDSRTPTQRDRDRILHSEALRRLANVTQVVNPSEGHVFHNRLTHTLKVAQIAQRLAEKLVAQQPDLAAALNLDPHATEAAALAHDLGHPPFGHVAERELDRLLVTEGFLEGFEGNPQSFRILTKLERRSQEPYGLNLTRATLNAVVKYPRLRESSGQWNRKWGAYSSEKQVFEWVRAYSQHQQRSLEAEIMDWADDIAFSVHDVEDFYRAGLIPPIIFSKEASTSELDIYFDEVLSKLERGGKQTEGTITRGDLRSIFGRIRLLLPFEEPYRNTQKSYGNLRFITSALIDRYINGLKIASNALHNPEAKTVEINDEYRWEIRLLKALTWRYVIHNRALATQQSGKRTIIRELFRIFKEALNSGDDEEKFILPEDYETQLQSIKEDLRNDYDGDDALEKSAKARLIGDIISSLTDNEALTMYKRFSGMDSGSILDRIPR